MASTEPVLVDARDRGDRERRQAGRAVAGDRVGHWGGSQAEVVVGRQHDQRLAWEPELIERSRDREVGLVAGVDARVLEVLAAGRRRQTP